MIKNKTITALLVATSIVSSVVTYSICKLSSQEPEKAENLNTVQTEQPQSNVCNYKIERLKGFKYIRPLVYAEPECEGAKYLPLKSQIQNKIDDYKKSNTLLSASVYLRGFNKGNWINVNPDEKFHPASLLKLGLLVTFLKMEEKNPGFLNTRLTFSDKQSETRIQTFNSKQIETGKSYSIKELLEYMVSYSDNNATNLLHDVMDAERRVLDFL